ncbi:MAG: hypothetical protein QGG34_02995 [SAR202 cluster bacterium]|nr:hypothetical protein [SAR202 cluster bacterium]MDP6302004.1 hypothetical protein [SAR202 cluster bacterium]MDP7103393.1 hypothetical protein [SAR202 cluster bacterium]MDP7223743.1 hypothetical protein [SAR202 cluster bacterium]MDP7415001.1 hypothetical protein [SAR202 cluster bacterium]
MLITCPTQTYVIRVLKGMSMLVLFSKMAVQRKYSMAATIIVGTSDVKK